MAVAAFANELKITSMKDVELGMFVRYTGKDDNGRWHHIGEVIEMTKPTDANPTTTFTMATLVGKMTFESTKSFSGAELYVTTKKPDGWEKFKKDPEKHSAAMKQKEEAKAVPILKTLKEQVYDLVVANAALSDAKLLKLIKNAASSGEDNTLKTYMLLARMKIKKGG